MAERPDLDEPDLVQLLLLEAGRLMEDLAPALAMRQPVDRAVRAEFIARVRQVSHDMSDIAGAAEALNRSRAGPI